MHIFYQENRELLRLESEEARHCHKVLRLRAGDSILVTDGRGWLAQAQLLKVDAHKVEYAVTDHKQLPSPERPLHMAVCPTRKAERNEWMVEKMTELGVQKIQFVISEHTHHETIRRVVNLERLQRIALSAMKQSRQYFLPEISLFLTFESYLTQVREEERYIAYVTDQNIPPHLYARISNGPASAVLIGPEGDFSSQEIQLAVQAGFEPVSLGATRLRTETAAIVACHTVNLALDQKF